MASTSDRLPSWRPGATRDALTGFLDAAVEIPADARIAYIDNDGTLWCEKPGYVQLGFFVDALRARAADDPTIAERPELRAVLDGDRSEMGAIGLARIAVALAGLFDGETPDAFRAAVREYMGRATHEALRRPVKTVVYQPMLELIAELRRLDFAVGVVTGGGTEFVRAISDELYGVPPERVVGTLIGYVFGRDDDGRPQLRRTASLTGDANEGTAKVEHIQADLGRQPILAVGNAGGDREMLEWACAGDGPRLAMLVDHDDADREYDYVSTAATFQDPEPITDVADRLGWTRISIANDWATVFPPVDPSPTDRGRRDGEAGAGAARRPAPRAGNN